MNTDNLTKIQDVTFFLTGSLDKWCGEAKKVLLGITNEGETERYYGLWLAEEIAGLLRNDSDEKRKTAAKWLLDAATKEKNKCTPTMFKWAVKDLRGATGFVEITIPYARNDQSLEELEGLMAKQFFVEVGRFEGIGFDRLPFQVFTLGETAGREFNGRPVFFRVALRPGGGTQWVRTHPY